MLIKNLCKRITLSSEKGAAMNDALFLSFHSLEAQYLVDGE